MSRHLKIKIVLVILSLGLPALAWGKSTAPQPSHQNKPAIVEADQMTNIPYFTLRDGLNSTLTLNNNAPDPTQVTVMIFNTEGRAQTLDPVTLDPHAFKQIELRDVVHGDFESGNIEVSYHGTPMRVTCQLSVYSLAKRVSFESREQDMMDFESANLNGILSLPQKEAQGFLAVTNVSKSQVTVNLAVGSKTKEIRLFSRETKLVKLDEEFGLKAPASGLVKLTQNGLPGDIITTGFVMDLEGGYSSAFTMVDPKLMRSSHLAGAHFRAGQPDPSEGFPAGTNFSSPLLLANVSDKPVAAHISVDYTVQEKLKMTPVDPKASDTKDKFSTMAMTDITIAPGDVQSIELSGELAKLGIPTPVEEAGVDVAYDASPGALVGQLTSVDQSGDYSFEVPIKDPLAMNEMTEGVYPWTLENGVKTVLHLKNTTDKNATATVIFNFPSGHYYPPRINLEPHQTVAIDIQKLKDSQKRDVTNHVFPADATHGQMEWVPERPNTLIGRAERVNMTAGIASSFSCGLDCCTNGYYQDLFCLSSNGSSCLSGSVTGDVGGSITLYGLEYGTSCTGSPVPPQTPYSYAGPENWSSTNTNVDTINWPQVGSGSVSLVGGGTANVEVDWYYREWYTYDYTSCQADDTNTTATIAQVTVRYPYRVEPIANQSNQFTLCTGTAAGWQRFVTNQLQAQDGGGYLHAGIAMADNIYFSGTNQLGLSPVTGNSTTDSNGSWSYDLYSVCSPYCSTPSSPGESDGTQYWTYNGNPLPHANTVVYKCGSITIDGN